MELAKKLAGVARKGFDITPLSLGIKGVERQGAFARAAYSGEDNQLIARQIEIDVLQVVLTRPRTTMVLFSVTNNRPVPYARLALKYKNTVYTSGAKIPRLVVPSSFVGEGAKAKPRFGGPGLLGGIR